MYKALFIALFLFIAGCSTSADPDTLSKSDLCIVKSDDAKQKVCYGMTRSKAEKVLGSGQKSTIGFKYDHGVQVMYRKNDRIATIHLSEKGVYKTARGAQIGDSKESLLALYGEKYPNVRDKSKPYTVEYAYDSKEKKFIGEASYGEISKDPKPEYYFFQAVLNENNQITDFYLSDMKAILLMQ